MDQIRLRPLAKINLGLDVVGLREDGYHEVRMVMQSLKLHDDLLMEKQKEGVLMKTNLRYLPCDADNLVVRAVELLRKEFSIETGVKINLRKVIPVAGGMAGGSADAAAALYGMNKLFDLKLSTRDLMGYGLKLGADVPFCVMRGTALSEGIGEILTAIPTPPQANVLIVKPRVGVSTKAVYDAFDKLTNPHHPDIDQLINGLDKGDWNEIIKGMGNSLEGVTIPMHPIIEDIKKRMMERGARISLMSGSGPTVFGIFDELADAKRAAALFRDMSDIQQVEVTGFYNGKGRA